MWRIKRIILIVGILLMYHNSVFADHLWSATDLQFTENPVGSGLFDITYDVVICGACTRLQYYELFVVESGCPPSDGFSFSDTGFVEGGGNDVSVATGVQLCPGKTYSILIYTRRMAGTAANPIPSDRDGSGTPSGLLIGFNPGDCGTFPWNGQPINYPDNDPATGPCGSGGCVEEDPNCPYDGNWAYLILEFTAPGTIPWDFSANIEVDDCFGDFDQSYSGTEADGTNITENFGRASAMVRCGSPVTITYNSNTNCGPDFPGNTYMITDASTLGGFDGSSSNFINPPSVVDDGGNGRFEILNNESISSIACADGEIAVSFENSECNAEDRAISVDITYDIQVLYPNSNFADIARLSCSSICGQELVLTGGPQWTAGGPNMGNATTVETAEALAQGFTFTWGGQICTATSTPSDCADGMASVTVDQCAGCGVYDITYAIENTNCPGCATMTTKQIEIVTPHITNLATDVTSGCGDVTPNITFDLVQCNALDGSISTVPYTGFGDVLIERDDDVGNLMPAATANVTVLEGTTVCFTVYFQTADCSICNTVSTTNVCVTGNILPMAGPPSSYEYCEGEDVPAIGAAGVVPGTSVVWYQDAAATIPVTAALVSGPSNEFITLSNVSMPNAPAPGVSITLYGQIVDPVTGCISRNTTPVTLTHNPAPEAFLSEMTLCETSLNARFTEFDLSVLIDDINSSFVEGTPSTVGLFTSSNFELTFHLSMSDADNNLNTITNPENFTNTALETQTLFVRVVDTNTNCYSVRQVNLNVAGLPDTDNQERFICEDPDTPGIRTGVDLTALEIVVAGGNPPYTVEWYSDMALTMLISPANNITVNDGDIYYARVILDEEPRCENVGVLTYEVGPAPPQQDLAVTFCEDGIGTGNVTVDLTTFNFAIAGGTSAIVSWFEDMAMTMPVPNASMVTVNLAGNTTTSNLFYADISDGVCSNTGTVDITVSEQPIADAGIDKEVCAGSNLALSDAILSGSASMGEWTITSSPVGGDGFVLPMGLIPAPSTGIFLATVPGTYTLRLTTESPDGPCGANFDEVQVVVNPLPVPVPMATEVCVNDMTVVTANVSGGTPPYITYTWVDLGTGNANNYTLSNMNTATLSLDATNATAGIVDVEVMVTDNKGCSETATTTITILPQPIVAPQAAEVCINSTLMIDGAVSGGTPGYIHQWMDLGTGSASAYTLSNMDMQVVTLDATGATIGTVDLQYAVTDSKGCSITGNVTITINPLPMPAPLPAMVCVNDMVLIDANTSGGTPAYTHTWTDLGTGTATGYNLFNTTTQIVSLDATGATAGTVDLEVIVVDEKGCINTADVTITIEPLPMAMPPIAETCAGETIMLDGTPSGGTPNYTHQWTDLGTGTASGYILMNTNSQVLTVETSGVAINSGTGTVNLQYQVTDSNGCVNAVNTTIQINPLPIPNPIPAMVCVGNTVMIDGAPTEGTMPYMMHQWTDLGIGTASNYTLLNTDMQIVTVDASTTTDSEAGTVILQYTVTDRNGCSQSEAILVTINPLPIITPTDANITCAPPQEAMVSVNTTAQNANYIWSGPGIVSGANTLSATVNLPGTYTVIVTDGITSCENTAQVFVTQDPLSKCLPATFEIKVKGGE